MKKNIMKNWRLFIGAAFLLSCALLTSLLLYSTLFDIPINVSNNPSNYDILAVVTADENNNVHIVWESYYYLPGAPYDTASDLFYTNNIGGSFAPPVQISVPTGWYSQSYSIALDSQGDAHIAFWRRKHQLAVMDDEIYYITNAGGSFGDPIVVADASMESTLSLVMSPTIQCDSQDNIHIVFIGALGGDTSGNDELFYMNNIGGNWSDYELVAQKIYLITQDACLDDQDNMHIVFSASENPGDDNSIYYTHSKSGNFITPVLASSPENEFAGEPKILIDSLGNAHVVYSAPSPSSSNLYYVNNVSGSFDNWTPICEPNDFIKPNIAIDDFDFIHIAYITYKENEGGLYFGSNINGDFIFNSYDKFDTDNWGMGSCYFTLRDYSTLHIVFSEWTGEPWDSDHEIFYLRGVKVLPDVPSDPLPADGATDKSLDFQSLDWSSSYALSYDIYCGDTSPPPLIDTVSHSYYDLYLEDFTLESETKYFWKIIAKNEWGETQGPEWSFTTEKTEAQLTLSFTSGGTTDPSPGTYTYDIGTQVNIRAIPDSGYQFSSWSGDASGTANPITITMDSDKSITANFSSTQTGGGDGDGDGGGGGCFIATAAYGSPLHPHLDILRDFRDTYLTSSKIGRKFLGLYYKYSPYIAELIAKRKVLRIAARINLLPFVVFSNSMVHFGPIMTVITLVFIFMFPIFLVSFFRRKLSRVEAKSPKALASLD